MSAEAGLEAVQCFLRIDACLATAGQPTATQLQSLRSQGIAHVINLALPTSTDAVPDEGGLVSGQGLNYFQLPVNWEAPEPEQFTRFAQVLWALREESVLVHCARNKRVSAFVFLYRVLYEAIPVEQAAVDMHKVWVPNEAWFRFIQSVLLPKGEFYAPPEDADLDA